MKLGRRSVDTDGVPVEPKEISKLYWDCGYRKPAETRVTQLSWADHGEYVSTEDAGIWKVKICYLSDSIISYNAESPVIKGNALLADAVWIVQCYLCLQPYRRRSESKHRNPNPLTPSRGSSTSYFTDIPSTNLLTPIRTTITNVHKPNPPNTHPIPIPLLAFLNPNPKGCNTR